MTLGCPKAHLLWFAQLTRGVAPKAHKQKPIQKLQIQGLDEEIAIHVVAIWNLKGQASSSKKLIETDFYVFAIWQLCQWELEFIPQYICSIWKLGSQFHVAKKNWKQVQVTANR